MSDILSSPAAAPSLLAPSLLARYDGLRVPRYTSYPTSPHFSPNVAADAYRGWLGELTPAQAGSLYLHVPFCKRMCWYCGCHTKIVARYQPVAEYLELMRREVAMVADAIPHRLAVRHVHFGGGTPTMLAPADFESLIALLRERFDLVPGAEIAVEIDPRTLTAEMAAALGRAGVNRASLGVQDFDPAVQEAINRVQPLAVTQRSLDWLRGAGITHINLDLMYGLPRQSVESVTRSAETAVGLGADRFSVFGYAHVPWMKTHQKKIVESELADGQGRWDQFAAIAAALTGAGYRAVGLDHFARADDELAVLQAEGRLARNFQGYTTDDAEVLLGFGASSIGALPQGYVQNAVPFDHYADAIAAGRLATAKGLRLTDDDRLRRAVIERLMCDLTVDVAAVAARFGARADAFDDVLSGMADLAADGVAVVEGRRVSVPEPARPLMRIVAARFDTYLATGAGKHSRAV
ncbi:oxygen-independent coproporphyrinogen III oxidase [Azospirillum sp. RWY-5-1]|uniref:Coproporphyrinogen-III oxidase n=1 Tax=Azospirillum oleiclasticum TaxID=2735135 RepID=A0ABX2TGF9_9PROT|nr:oxygen-independent coproporphyrinogen III oxidase [Azospirillum oleiclasticum]NYZ17272.1 oxygen-independent coproporphyrinogen III oxidase [Azospirillum oleiclasticum]NYZ23444.1 oxygen-independent coproporphyrinogen III oxidase [Azospirillum oleiclasticum]